MLVPIRIVTWKSKTPSFIPYTQLTPTVFCPSLSVTMITLYRIVCFIFSYFYGIIPQHFTVKIFKHREKLKELQTEHLYLLYHLHSTLNIFLYLPYHLHPSAHLSVYPLFQTTIFRLILIPLKERELLYRSVVCPLHTGMTSETERAQESLKKEEMKEGRQR